MAGLLGQVFSAGNVARRKLTDLLGNPVLSAQQIVGNLNDRARVLNEMTSAAAQEGVNYGPASRQLAGLLAEAYNPIGMVVYHGSPAKFSRFDPTKIGSGEGAQAYGYGHYVAEAPETAKQYKEMLKSKAFSKIVQRDRNVYDVIAPDGTVVSQGTVLGKAHKAKDAYDANVGSVYEIDLPDEQIARMLDYDKPLSKQAPEVQSALAKLGIKVDKKKVDEFHDALLNALENPDLTPVTLPKTPRDWTGEQILKMIERNPSQYFPSAMEGKELTGAMLDPRVGASELLRRQGIPGIRYLDQSSRGINQTWVVNNPKFGSYDFPSLEEAQAFIKSNPQDKLELIEPQKTTSNFVVFPGNEDMLTILKRNGGLLGP